MRPGVKRLGGAEEAVAGRDPAPAAPAQTPGSHRRGGKPGRWATAGARRLLPASLSVPGNPRLLGASGIVRFGVTPGHLSPRFGGRGASPKRAG